MITITKTKRGELPLVFMLYRSAFPRCERKPFQLLVQFFLLEY